MTEPIPWYANADQWQDITNERPVPPLAEQTGDSDLTPVTARIHWARDGEEQFDTVAVAWHQHTVLVRIEDPRRRTIGVWLDKDDVKRRQPPP